MVINKLRGTFGGQHFLSWLCIVLLIVTTGLYIQVQELDDTARRSEAAAVKASDELTAAINAQDPDRTRAFFEAIFYIEAILRQEFGELDPAADSGG